MRRYSIISLSLVIAALLSSCSDSGNKEEDKDALGAVLYLTYGVSVGDSESVARKKYVWESPEIGKYKLKFEGGEKELSVSKIDNCKYTVGIGIKVDGSPDQAAEREVNFNTLSSIDGFTVRDLEQNNLKIGYEAYWHLKFTDSCAVKMLADPASETSKDVCTNSFAGVSRVVDEKRLRAAYDYFKKDVCAGQKF